MSSELEAYIASRPELPETMQPGTVIEGVITVDGIQKQVRVTVGLHAMPLTAEEHLLMAQSRQGGGANGNSADVKVTGVEKFNILDNPDGVQKIIGLTETKLELLDGVNGGNKIGRLIGDLRGWIGSRVKSV